MTTDIQYTQGFSEEIIEEFKTIRNDLFDLIEAFPEKKQEEELFDGRSIKQLVLHITLAEMFMIALLEDLKEGREITWEDPYDETDPVTHADSDWEELLDDLSFTGSRLFVTLETFPTKLWLQKIWQDRNITPHKLVGIDLGHYKDVYIPEIEKHIDADELIIDAEGDELFFM